MKKLLVLSLVALFSLVAFACQMAGAGGGLQTPANVSAVVTTTGDGEITVSWDAVGGASSYNLYWASGSAVTTSSGTKISGVTSPYVVNNLSQGTEYAFTVTAVDSGGESGAAKAATATIPTTTKHVYISGWVGGPQINGTLAAYWRDGVEHEISTSEGYWAYDVAVSGSDVYLSGMDDANTTYVYWKNDTMTTLALPSGFTPDLSPRIVVSGGHVWVAAQAFDGSGNDQVVEWEDGGAPTVLPLVSGDTFAHFKTLVADSTDAVGIGESFSANQDEPVIWDNGAIVRLADQTGSAAGTTGTTLGGLFSGSTRYICGYVDDGAYPHTAGYWKGTSFFPVSNYGTSPINRAYDIALDGTSVYLAGTTKDISGTNTSVPLYWDPSGKVTELPLPSGDTIGAAHFIGVAGGHVYIAGYPVNDSEYYSASNPLTPLFWVDGSLTTLDLPSGDSAALLDTMVSTGDAAYLVGLTGTASGSGYNIDYNDAFHAVYWKDGNLNVLPLGAQETGARANFARVFPS